MLANLHHEKYFHRLTKLTLLTNQNQFKAILN